MLTMFSPYGSLLSDGSEDAAFLRPLPLFLVPVSPPSVSRKANPPREISFV